MPDKERFRIRIARDGFELDVEGDRAFIDDMLGRYLEVPPSGEPKLRASSDSVRDESGTKVLSPSEFIRQFGFTKYTDRTVAFGYYLEEIRGRESFTTSDINAMYYEAKMETTNTSASFSQLVKRGHLMEAKGAPKAKAYILTQSGVRFIEEALAALPE